MICAGESEVFAEFSSHEVFSDAFAGALTHRGSASQSYQKLTLTLIYRITYRRHF